MSPKLNKQDFEINPELDEANNIACGYDRRYYCH